MTQDLTQAQKSNPSLPWAQCASSLLVFTWLAIASLMNTKLQNKVTGALCCLSEQELDHHDKFKKKRQKRLDASVLMIEKVSAVILRSQFNTDLSQPH